MRKRRKGARYAPPSGVGKERRNRGAPLRHPRARAEPGRSPAPGWARARMGQTEAPGVLRFLQTLPYWRNAGAYPAKSTWRVNFMTKVLSAGSSASRGKSPMIPLTSISCRSL